MSNIIPLVDRTPGRKAAIEYLHQKHRERRAAETLTRTALLCFMAGMVIGKTIAVSAITKKNSNLFIE